MAKKFYIADWHYDHANILSFDSRKFTDVNEMNKELVRRWNSVVAPEDIVYSLGDMFWCKSSDALPILDALNGQKFLIRGNHDRTKDSKFINKFVKVTDYLEVEDGDKNIVLCHYPIPCFKNHYYGWYHLYGHIHSSFEYNMMERIKYEMEELYTVPCNMYNCGAMMPWVDYTPRTIDEIIEGYNKYGAD